MTRGFSNSGNGVTVEESVPHSARVWNYWLGGKDNYAVDRAAGDAWTAVHPEAVTIARETRAFLARAVEYLAGEAGIRQFLDVGSGLPTADNTHEIAQRVAPESRIVYVDRDPLVIGQARALLTSSPEGATRFVQADMRDTDALVEGAGEILDLTGPVAVFFLGVLGHVADFDESRALVRRLMDRLPAGSHLTVIEGIHPADRTEPTAFERAHQAYFGTGALAYFTRTPAEVASYFDGLELVEPGFVPATLWRPAEGTAPEPVEACGGVARKR
jgi:O-methyltransferase involved in polyketide biosynthesis